MTLEPNTKFRSQVPLVTRKSLPLFGGLSDKRIERWFIRSNWWDWLHQELEVSALEDLGDGLRQAEALPYVIEVSLREASCWTLAHSQGSFSGVSLDSSEPKMKMPHAVGSKGTPTTVLQ